MTDQNALKRYAVAVLVGAGTAGETTRDSGIIFAANDAEAWTKALEWFETVKGNAVDGDYLQLVENGRGVKGTLLTKVL